MSYMEMKEYSQMYTKSPMKASVIVNSDINVLKETILFIMQYNLKIRFYKELGGIEFTNIKVFLALLEEFKRTHTYEIRHNTKGDLLFDYVREDHIVDGNYRFRLVLSKGANEDNSIVEVRSMDNLPVVSTLKDYLAVVNDMVKDDEKFEVGKDNVDMSKLFTNLNTLAHKFPWEVQKTQLVEEMGELLQAVSKYERANGVGQPTNITPDEAKKNLIEEIAGVSVMLCEIVEMLNIKSSVKHEMLEQTDRTMERLKRMKPKTTE